MPEHISIRIAGKFVQAQKMLDLYLKTIITLLVVKLPLIIYLFLNLTNRRQNNVVVATIVICKIVFFIYFLRSLVYFTSFSSPQITFVHAPLSCLFCTLFEFQLLTVDGRRQSLYFGCGLHFTYLCTLRRLTTKQLWSFKT